MVSDLFLSICLRSDEAIPAACATAIPSNVVAETLGCVAYAGLVATNRAVDHRNGREHQRNGKKMGQCFGPCQNPVIPRALNFREYDIREIDEELYLSVLDRAKAVREGDLTT